MQSRAHSFTEPRTLLFLQANIRPGPEVAALPQQSRRKTFVSLLFFHPPGNFKIIIARYSYSEKVFEADDPPLAAGPPSSAALLGGRGMRRGCGCVRCNNIASLYYLYKVKRSHRCWKCADKKNNKPFTSSSPSSPSK